MDLASCCIGVFVCVGVSCCVFCYKKKRYKFILLAVRNVGLVTLDYYLFHHYNIKFGVKTKVRKLVNKLPIIHI